MLRRHVFALRLLLLTADVLGAAVLFLLVGYIRFGDAQWTTMWQALNVDSTVGAGLYALAWASILWFLGLYALRVRWTIGGELNDILVASVMLAFGTMSFLFLVQLDVSRLFLFIVFLAQPILTMTERLWLRIVFNGLRARGYNRCNMLVVGVGSEAQEFAEAVERHRELGIEIIGHLRGPGERPDEVSRPILGSATDLGRILHGRVVDEVAICVAPELATWSGPLIRLAADEGKTVRIPTRIPVRAFDLQAEELDGMTIRSYVNGPTKILSLVVKRSIDLAGSALGLVLLSPLFLIVAVAIVLRDGRPVLFKQVRVGLNGRPFQVVKFRTMSRDAEAQLDRLAVQSDTKGAAFTMRRDPRVTKLGALLRRTSLDELPQLANVLRGEMSLIGPRPAPPREVIRYDDWHRRRLSMRPGITGLSQVRTRLDAHFDERAHLDLEYIDQWSLGRDLKILLRTVPAVLKWMDK